ncbi:hypothetical protein LCGC14_2693890 [marine sediment metagenome]|uniref:Uncharacterized protein n=1 Tax=marine sediment metagenome TaxID=412755 RepID=A0A0F9C9G8_9ZZZZ
MKNIDSYRNLLIGLTKTFKETGGIDKSDSNHVIKEFMKLIVDSIEFHTGLDLDNQFQDLYE